MGRQEIYSGCCAGYFYRTHPADVADGTRLRRGRDAWYRRHGTTTLFAAMDTAKGTVLTRKRHRHQEYLDFLR